MAAVPLPPNPGNDTGPGPEPLHLPVDTDADLHPPQTTVVPTETESEPSHPQVMPMADQPGTTPWARESKWGNQKAKWRRIKVSGPPPAPWHGRPSDRTGRQYDTYEIQYSTYTGIGADVGFSLPRGISYLTRLGALAFKMGMTPMRMFPDQMPECRLDHVLGSHFPSCLMWDPGVSPP